VLSKARQATEPTDLVDSILRIVMHLLSSLQGGKQGGGGGGEEEEAPTEALSPSPNSFSLMYSPCVWIHDLESQQSPKQWKNGKAWQGVVVVE